MPIKKQKNFFWLWRVYQPISQTKGVWNKTQLCVLRNTLSVVSWALYTGSVCRKPSTHLQAFLPPNVENVPCIHLRDMISKQQRPNKSPSSRAGSTYTIWNLLLVSPWSNPRTWLHRNPPSSPPFLQKDRLAFEFGRGTSRSWGIGTRARARIRLDRWRSSRETLQTLGWLEPYTITTWLQTATCSFLTFKVLSRSNSKSEAQCSESVEEFSLDLSQLILVDQSHCPTSFF